MSFNTTPELQHSATRRSKLIYDRSSLQHIQHDTGGEKLREDDGVGLVEDMSQSDHARHTGYHGMTF